MILSHSKTRGEFMKVRTIIAASIIALIIVGFVAFYVHDQIVPMSENDIGNSAGNLHNNGFVFEMDGKVYFSNPYDSNCLYSMNLDESNPKCLTSMGVKYINGANGFLYYYMDSTQMKKNVHGLGTATNQYGLYRSRTNGNNQVCLLRDFCGEVQLCGEYLYYQVKSNGGTLDKIRVNKTHKSLVLNEMVSPVCYENGVIYYTGVNDDHNIHALYTQSGDSTTDLLAGNLFYPVAQGGYLYYLDGDSNYSLWRANLYSGAKELVTSDRIDCYTMDDNYIYYAFSNADNPSLKRCNLDGSNTVILYEGVVNSLNLTSKYLYFKVYGNDEMMYHMPLDGSSPASVFVIK